MSKAENSTFIIPLEGVESEHCVMIVDNGLKNLDGIVSHKVELNNQREL